MDASSRPLALTLERHCRYGHGPLELQQGVYSLAGMAPAAEGPSTMLEQTSKVFTARVWLCPHCRYVELSDAL